MNMELEAVEKQWVNYEVNAKVAEEEKQWLGFVSFITAWPHLF
ncbi:hypothetical protein Gohar_027447, partial [Gossypium harknessii]|nr:hypothetical protein [Gossypium harknessii]